MAKRYNPNLPKLGRNYYIEEVAALYDVHPQTVRAWGRDGLRIIRDQKPHLILGSDLREYLKGKRRSTSKLRKDELYCLSCRAATKPMGMLADYFPKSDSHGLLSGICDRCESMSHRFISAANIPLDTPNLDVSFQGEMPSLEEPPHTPSKTHMK